MAYNDDGDDYYYAEQQRLEQQRQQQQQQQEQDRLRWSQEQQDRELDYYNNTSYGQDYDYGRDSWSEPEITY